MRAWQHQHAHEAQTHQCVYACCIRSHRWHRPCWPAAALRSEAAACLQALPQAVDPALHAWLPLRRWCRWCHWPGAYAPLRGVQCWDAGCAGQASAQGCARNEETCGRWYIRSVGKSERAYVTKQCPKMPLKSKLGMKQTQHARIYVAGGWENQHQEPNSTGC